MCPNRRVKSSETMFAIVDALREHERLGVTELSELLDISKGAVHHHLATMRDHDYVTKEGEKYVIGLEFFAAGIDARNRYPIYQGAKKELPKLAAETGETAWCMVEENDKGIFIDGYVSSTSPNPDAVIGTWKPLHCNSAGKAILANLPPERRDAIIQRNGLAAVTDQTITDTDQLRRELEEIRKKGYSINLEEDVGGIHAVGAPVFDNKSRVVGAISVGGAAARIPERYCREELAPQIKATADTIGFKLAYD